MGRSEIYARSGLIWILLATVLFSVAALLVWSESKTEKRAKIIITRVWGKNIAAFLNQEAGEEGSLADFNKHLVFSPVSGTNNFKPQWTNAQGEAVDYWKMPFQIEITGQTNFIIRSAGPNQKFCDKDDIIFNSVSNDFVKP